MTFSNNSGDIVTAVAVLCRPFSSSCRVVVTPVSVPLDILNIAGLNVFFSILYIDDHLRKRRRLGSRCCRQSNRLPFYISPSSGLSRIGAA